MSITSWDEWIWNESILAGDRTRVLLAQSYIKTFYKNVNSKNDVILNCPT